jgi:predicted ribosomally synthesized peptide with SipW-like signal peptide
MQTSRKSWPEGLKLSLTLLLLGLVGALAGIGTWAAFSSTARNEGNNFRAGTVVLGDDDGDAVMLTLTDAQPGQFDEGCIRVSSSGSITSRVRLFGTTGGTGLDQYLDLKITRGTKTVPTGFDGCSDFQADSSNYIGAGNGVIYSGTLVGFPDNYDSGLVDPTAGFPESWGSSESHVYKIRVTVQDNEAAVGLSATQTFIWEARNT